MRVKLLKNYKSLSSFTSDDLPDFTVIVGKNGSGKSQLIQKFTELSKIKRAIELDIVGLSVTPELKRIYSDTLIIDNIKGVEPAEYINLRKALYQGYISNIHTHEIKKAWANIYEKKILPEKIYMYEINSFDDAYELKNLLTHGDSVFVNSDIEHLPAMSIPGEDRTTFLYKEYLRVLKNSLNSYEASLFVCEYHKKKILELKESDFLNANLPDKYLEKSDLIDSKIETVFYNYLRKRQKNSFDYFQKTQNNEDNPSMSSEEFNRIYQNPIKQLNGILESVNLPYCFKEISDKDFSTEINIQFDFIKTTSGKSIQFANLSSGEKIILGLVIRLFTSEFYKTDLRFPDLIILDEPDAHLHPEMCKLLIDVLNEAFVNRIGIKVIITTHSPTTVALAPEESVFQLINEPETSLKKISKDNALKVLTTGLPNLSIDYKNHRQIFVESPTDLEYYQSIFNKLNAVDPQTHQLYFISNGYGKSNCDQVIKIVNDLRESGNTTCKGIIDWDKKNSNKTNVYVHGHNRRYSIENYIFDPIYLSILLIEKNFGLLKKAIDYEDNENQYDIIKSEKAQKAIDYVVSSLESRNNQMGMDKRLVSHQYGDYSYNIPVWFTNMQGHDLKSQLIDKFPILETIKTAGEYELEKRLLVIIGKMYPNVPFDTVELLKKLSS